MEGIRVIVRELKKILETLGDEMEVVIEYRDRPNVYVKEDVFGLRIERPHEVVILGDSENS